MDSDRHKYLDSWFAALRPALVTSSSQRRHSLLQRRLTDEERKDRERMKRIENNATRDLMTRLVNNTISRRDYENVFYADPPPESEVGGTMSVKNAFRVFDEADALYEMGESISAFERIISAIATLVAISPVLIPSKRVVAMGRVEKFLVRAEKMKVDIVQGATKIKEERDIATEFENDSECTSSEIETRPSVGMSKEGSVRTKAGLNVRSISPSLSFSSASPKTDKRDLEKHSKAKNKAVATASDVIALRREVSIRTFRRESETPTSSSSSIGTCESSVVGGSLVHARTETTEVSDALDFKENELEYLSDRWLRLQTFDPEINSHFEDVQEEDSGRTLRRKIMLNNFNARVALNKFKKGIVNAKELRHLLGIFGSVLPPVGTSYRKLEPPTVASGKAVRVLGVDTSTKTNTSEIFDHEVSTTSHSPSMLLPSTPRIRIGSGGTLGAISHLDLEWNEKRDLIGKGTSGSVYRATYFGRRVAVKVLKESIDEDETKGFVKELKLLSTLSHANIVQLLGVCMRLPEERGAGDCTRNNGDDDDYPRMAIVMELCPFTLLDVLYKRVHRRKWNRRTFGTIVDDMVKGMVRA